VNPVCIITALPAESRVFIDALRLRHVQDCGWRLYARDHYRLLQTGLGKLKAAAATSTLLHAQPDISAVINVGVAGGTQPTGTCLQAHKITDEGTGTSWYPHLPPKRLTPDLQCTEVLTLDRISDQYRTDTVFDMEAAGVMSAATAYLSTDAIQCVKVISDNPDSPVQSFSKQVAIEHMQHTVPPVLEMLRWYEQMENSSARQSEISSLARQITVEVRHTMSESHQLTRLLHRYNSLTNNKLDVQQLQTLKSATAVRQYLEKQLSDVPLTYE